MSTPEMRSCVVYRLMIFLLILHAPMGTVRASRSLDFASELASTFRSRQLLDLQHDSRTMAQPVDVEPEKLPRKNRFITANPQEFSGKLLAREMGSKPPNCDGKCDLCGPCKAVEMPISNHSDQAREDSQNSPSTQSAEPDDTNYMPESWRCACGSEYYNP